MRDLLWTLSILVFAAAPCAAPLEAAEGWPQFRGPGRNGLSSEKGLLKKWPKEGPALLWTAKGLGTGYSSIAIAGGKIFTLGDREGKQQVIALDLESRKELWAVPLGGPWDDGGSRGTPTVDGDRVFAIGAHGDLVALEAASGKELWRKSFEKDFDGAMMSGWKYSESPLVDGDQLVCTPGGKDAALVALNKSSGDLIWKASLPDDLGPKGKDGAGYSSCVVAEVGGIRQYVQMMGRGVVAVAAKDGKFLWGYNKVANDVANITSPLVKGNLVFCTTSYGTGSALLKLTAQGGGIKAEEVYFLNGGQFQNHHGGVVLVGDHIYGGHGQNQGQPTCIDMKTGKILWKEKGPGEGSAAVICADGLLYFRYDNGVVALIEANPKGYKLVASFATPKSGGPAWAHPVILDGKLYLRWVDSLLCYELSVPLASSGEAAGGVLKAGALPPPPRSGGMSLVEALWKRRSVRAYADRPVTREELSFVLWAADGVNRPDEKEKKRTAPSAWGSNAISIYVVTAAGTFIYDAPEHSLKTVEAAAGKDLRPEVAGAEFTRKAPVVLVLAVDPVRYANKGTPEMRREIAHADCGIIAQNICLAAASLGLGTVVTADTKPASAPLLGLSGEARPLYTMPLGRP